MNLASVSVCPALLAATPTVTKHILLSGIWHPKDLHHSKCHTSYAKITKFFAYLASVSVCLTLLVAIPIVTETHPTVGQMTFERY